MTDTKKPTAHPEHLASIRENRHPGTRAATLAEVERALASARDAALANPRMPLPFVEGLMESVLVLRRMQSEGPAGASAEVELFPAAPCGWTSIEGVVCGAPRNSHGTGCLSRPHAYVPQRD